MTKSHPKEYFRIVVPTICGLVHFLIALKLRPEVTDGSPEWYVFLLGVIPSYLTVFGLYFLVSFFVKVPPVGLLIGVYIGAILQELQQVSYTTQDAGIVGRTFDYGDLVFLTFSALTAFAIERKKNRM